MSPASGDSGPREGLRRKRSEGRLRTPLPWRGLDGLSSLWKTLRVTALQGRAPNDANTGVSANPGGVRGSRKGQQARRLKGSASAPWSRTPPRPDGSRSARSGSGVSSPVTAIHGTHLPCLRANGSGRDRSAADGLPSIRPAGASSGSLFTGWAVIQSPSVAVETVLLSLGPIDWRRPLGNKSECGRRVVPPPPPSSGRAWGRRSSAGWIRMLVPPCQSPSYAPSHKIHGWPLCSGGSRLCC